MPTRFKQQHWVPFSNTTFVAQGPFGRVPARWAAAHNIPTQGLALPAHQLTRQQVRAECRGPNPVLHGYICAMAWGMQGAGPMNAHAQTAWGHHVEIEARLQTLRAGALSREDAYNVFAVDPIPCLGPSYFTKLIYFFSPGEEPLGYIMDQWTGKSVNLITGHHVVRMNGHAPSASNTAENYDSYCKVVDFIATHCDCSGDQIEQRLFSTNAQGRRPRGAWRSHVVTRWQHDRPTHRYDHLVMKDWVANLV